MNAGILRLEVPSVVALNQIRSIDLQRLAARLGTLKPETMERVDRADVEAIEHRQARYLNNRIEADPGPISSGCAERRSASSR